ncbi:MAG: tetratricopeptide repeat protein [Deltaproteobacteria bacterium]|nr:tetratricopeptide repeat protein [Deltaproteobacteria bacterium]
MMRLAGLVCRVAGRGVTTKPLAKKTPFRLLAAAVLLCFLASACATTSVDVAVKRAPKFYLAQMGKVAYEVRVTNGDIAWERSQDCQYDAQGGHRSGKEGGKTSQERLNEYRRSLEQALKNALLSSKPPLQLVDKAQADAIVTVAAVVTETKSAESKRCAGDGCLPDLENGKKCGCSAALQGKLNVTDYDWAVTVSGRVELFGLAQVTSAGQDVGRQDFFLNGAGSPFGGVIHCRVHGSPDVVTSCVDGKQQIEVPYDKLFRKSSEQVFVNAKTAFTQMFSPYEETVRLVVFKLDEPKGADEAVDAIKENRWDEARKILEQNLDLVRGQGALKAEEQSHFLYDYGLVLLHAGEFDQAAKVFGEAASVFWDKRYQTAIDECDRQKGDMAALAKKTASAEATPGSEAPSDVAGTGETEEDNKTGSSEEEPSEGNGGTGK